MKSCELCKCMARIYCESDQASLCWTCDAKVHSANFLVARHLRSLLCHSCQSPTPWSASGVKLGRAFTLCVGCIDGCDRLKEGETERTDESRGGNNDNFESESEYYSDEDDEEDRLDEDEEDNGENQVVPWSSTSPPAVESSSESEEFSTGYIDISSKRSRENDADLSSKDDFSSTSRRNNQMIASETAAARCIRGGEDAFADSLYLRPLKIMRKCFDANRAAGVEHTSGAETIVEALERFHEQVMTSSSNKASDEAVDLDLSECP